MDIRQRPRFAHNTQLTLHVFVSYDLYNEKLSKIFGKIIKKLSVKFSKTILECSEFLKLIAVDVCACDSYEYFFHLSKNLNSLSL